MPLSAPSQPSAGAGLNWTYVFTPAVKKAEQSSATRATLSPAVTVAATTLIRLVLVLPKWKLPAARVLPVYDVLVGQSRKSGHKNRSLSGL